MIPRNVLPLLLWVLVSCGKPFHESCGFHGEIDSLLKTVDERVKRHVGDQGVRRQHVILNVTKENISIEGAYFAQHLDVWTVAFVYDVCNDSLVILPKLTQ